MYASKKFANPGTVGAIKDRLAAKAAGGRAPLPESAPAVASIQLTAAAARVYVVRDIEEGPGFSRPRTPAARSQFPSIRLAVTPADNICRNARAAEALELAPAEV